MTKKKSFWLVLLCLLTIAILFVGKFVFNKPSRSGTVIDRPEERRQTPLNTAALSPLFGGRTIDEVNQANPAISANGSRPTISPVAAERLKALEIALGADAIGIESYEILRSAVMSSISETDRSHLAQKVALLKQDADHALDILDAMASRLDPSIFAYEHVYIQELMAALELPDAYVYEASVEILAGDGVQRKESYAGSDDRTLVPETLLAITATANMVRTAPSAEAAMQNTLRAIRLQENKVVRQAMGQEFIKRHEDLEQVFTLLVKEAQLY